MSKWQPIATAPKDGPILVWDSRQRTSRVAFFATALEDGSQDWIYARRLNFDDPTHAIAFIVQEPTHWMPLPEPPK